ncbi:unnamed protein product [Caenorhabditis brenneri]
MSWKQHQDSHKSSALVKSVNRHGVHESSSQEIQETEECIHRRLSPEVGRSQGVEVAIQGAEPHSLARSRISFKDERNSEIDEEHQRCQRISRVTSSKIGFENEVVKRFAQRIVSQNNTARSPDCSVVSKDNSGSLRQMVQADKMNQRISWRSVQALVKEVPRRQVKFLTSSIGSFVHDSSS